MYSPKLGKNQSGADAISKENMKEGSKLAHQASGKITKRHLPLPLPTQHQQVITSSSSSSSSSSPPSITPPSSASSMASSSSMAIPSSSLWSSSTSSSSPSSLSSSSSSSSSPTAIASPSSSPTATLHELLKNIAGQRNQILGLINAIDPSFLASMSPKSIHEHKLLNQVTELQGRIIAVSEEIHHMRAKNAQLEHELSAYCDKMAAS